MLIATLIVGKFVADLAWRPRFGSLIHVMNVTGSMGLAITVRSCCRRLAAQIFPGCIHHYHHLGCRRFCRCPQPLPHSRSAADWARFAFAQAKDQAASSNTRLASTSNWIERSGDKAFVHGLTSANPLVTEKVEVAEDKRRNAGEEEEKEEVKERYEVEKARGTSESGKEAWRLLKNAVVTYCGNSVGTLAANDSVVESLNYDQVFIRDFVPSALAFLLKGETEIVRNFLLHTLQLQSWEKTVDCYSPGQGLMPASFKVRNVPHGSEGKLEEVLDADFGESAIGRVAPVDSGLWWIMLLRAYGKISGDYSLQERVDMQTGIKLILKLCLSDGFDMFPTLLVTDGSCMIDRRMGIHGDPLEIQALFYGVLRCSRELIVSNDGGSGSKSLLRAINNRLSALSFHIREYYWADMRKVNEIYRYKTEEYSHDAINKFNIYPEQIPCWLVDWIPEKGGYFIGNLQPAHMDFRFFTLGNLWAIVSSLATPRQAEGILDLIQDKWEDIVATMPMKISYPAIENEEWHITTGSDPKNTCGCAKDKGAAMQRQRLTMVHFTFPSLFDEKTSCNMCHAIVCKVGLPKLAIFYLSPNFVY